MPNSLYKYEERMVSTYDNMLRSPANISENHRAIQFYEVQRAQRCSLSMRHKSLSLSPSPSLSSLSSHLLHLFLSLSSSIIFLTSSDNFFHFPFFLPTFLPTYLPSFLPSFLPSSLFSASPVSRNRALKELCRPSSAANICALKPGRTMTRK